MSLQHHYAYHWPIWLRYHKAIFDGENRLIYIDPSVTEIDVRVDLYSDWKEWVLTSQEANGASKWVAAMRAVGGDPLPGDEFLGRTFFLINGWRIVLTHGINFTGNLFTEEGDSPFITTDGVEIATSTVSTLVVENTVEATVTAEDISQAVWDQDPNNLISGSVGEILLNIQNTVIVETAQTASGTAANTAGSLFTNLTKPNNYYNNMFVLVIDPNGNNAATRQIDQYWETGQMDLIEDLPFVPSVNASYVILNKHNINRGRLN